MRVWATADTHFGHTNIMKYCDREFSDVWEMNVHIANEWNARVSDDDVVLHLGDVTLIKDTSQYTNTIDLIRSLKGRVILTPGNHDKNGMIEAYSGWGWKIMKSITIGDIMFIHRPPVLIPDGIKLIVHGHTHGTFKQEGFVDVGVDSISNYSPVDLSTLLMTEQFDVILHGIFGIVNTS